MKVLHVITGLASGGAETQLRSLVAHSAHRADVVCLYNPGVVADGLRADGVEVIDLRMRSNRDVGAVVRLARLIRAGRYDVVHTHLYRACVYGRPAARLAGVRAVVATEHSLQDGQLEGRLATAGVRRLYLATEKLGRTTIAVSAAVERDLRGWGVPAGRIARIPNGLDLDALAFDPSARARVRAELGIAADARVIGTVGRLHPGKRIDELLRAAAPLVHGGTHLLVVGEGPARAELEQLAQQLGLTGRVHLVGERAPAPHLAAMDVFASPSPFETFGLAVVEALANGLPAVYRRCPAVEELGSPPRLAAAIGPDGSALRRARVDALDRGTGDRRCPPELAGLAMPAVAAAVDEVYRRAG